MNIDIREISGLKEAQGMLRELGVDPAGVGIMAKKMLMRVFFVKDMSVRAANILKQECIAVGGDLALPKAASMLRGERTDAVMMMSESALERLLVGLRAQPFGLAKFGESVRDVVRERPHGTILLNRNREQSSLRSLAKIMGVMNLTPDSFSDGGKFFAGGKVNVDVVLRRVDAMIDEGADIVDIGGESTGPDSVAVSAKEELARLAPVLEIFARKKIYKRVKVSVDTSKSVVAHAAIMSGAQMINDVTALRGDRKMAAVLAKSSDVGVVMMYAVAHDGRTTRDKKQYLDVMKTIREFFEERLAYAEKSGIARERIVLDPGMGAFVSGDAKYSFEILRRLGELRIFGLPLLVGTSRKGFLGGDLVSDDRLPASLATANMAYVNGASILRVHDVEASRASLDAVLKTL